MSRKPLTSAFALAVLVLVLVPSLAFAADRVETIKSVDGPGPAKYDRVRVLKQGPPKAKNVLVLMPGTSASASYFKPFAESLLKRLPGWQVWSVDRRETALEDQSMLRAVQRGRRPVSDLFPYYLGWIGKEGGGKHFEPVADGEVPYARRWGMATAIGDLRKVVKSAKRGGRRVVLGGHSLGGSITVAYATWDFNGRAGAEDLDGIVLIDGGSGGEPLTVADADSRLAELERGSPFLNLTGTFPWAAGVFNAVGSTLALKDPAAPSVLGEWPLLPANLKAPVRVTNYAGYGYALDTETGPASLALVQVHVGGLAGSGDPRGWVDGELGSVGRTAKVFSGIPGMDGTSWYHPIRLSLDSASVAGGVRNPAQDRLGVRAWHGDDLALPIYAFETSLGKGRVLAGARALARRSGIRGADVRLVGRSKTFAHIDPLSAAPERNDFLKTVAPFLRRAVR